MSAQQIRQRIEQILHYMDDSYWDLVNCHMVNFLTHNHWSSFVSGSIQTEIQSSSDVKCCIEELLWNNSNKGQARFPKCSVFLQKSREHTLDNFSEIVVNTKEFYRKYNFENLQLPLNVKEFLTDKKVHEVETMAELTNNIMQICCKQTPDDNITVVDIGDGKGYLSSRLALQYNCTVVGIDQNENNTINAVERSKRLQRVWPALIERERLKKCKMTEKYEASIKEGSSQTYKYTTVAKFVTPDLDVSSVLCEVLPNTFIQSYGIVGLHTCGNLASTSLQLYKQPHCVFLCNVGCCYHLLDEYFLNGESTSLDSSKFGFPMSTFLQEKKIKLGRNARMLAAQSIERTLNAKDLPSISLFYRALLEVLIATPEVKKSIKIGKIKKYENFAHYVQKSGMLRNTKMNVEELEEFAQRNCSNKDFLDLFYLLRMSFAPILESLMLLDRLLYLKELGYEHSYIVSLFDPVVSPRRFAIVSIKNSACGSIL